MPLTRVEYTPEKQAVLEGVDIMESIEQQLIQMLKHLPVPITITWASGLYQWQADGREGSASDIVTAMGRALHSVLGEYSQSTRRAKSS
jgi:hypothetical protein